MNLLSKNLIRIYLLTDIVKISVKMIRMTRAVRVKEAAKFYRLRALIILKIKVKGTKDNLRFTLIIKRLMELMKIRDKKDTV